jgi:RimJ/RimL family protein N-acetyltransferase
VRREIDDFATLTVGDDSLMPPPDRIDLDDVGAVLRRLAVDDVDALQTVIESSREHLRPFMPWADQDYETTAAFAAKAAASWATGDGFAYVVVESSPATRHAERLLGGCGLHRRGGPESIEIGYWLRPDAVGRGVMTAAARALTAAAFNLEGITRVEIRCDAANVRSAAIPRRLGYRHVGDEDGEPQAAGESGRKQIWACDDPAVVGGATSPS